MYFDLKPANIMLGSGKDADQVYVVDWGCCRSYKDLAGALLTSPIDAGNDMFRSINAHNQHREWR